MVTEQKTRCPHCNTTFRITRKQLDAASGVVRCGKCFNTFNGFDGLIATRSETPASEPQKPPSPEPTPAQSPVQRPETRDEDDDDFLIDDNFDVSLLDKNPLSQDTPEPTTQAEDGDSDSQPSAPTPKPDLAEGIDSVTGDEEEEKEVVFTAGSPVLTNIEELEEAEIETGDMSSWRPETHNIIPDAGLIGRHHADIKNPYAWLWFFGSLVAALTLALQMVYFNSLTIERDSSFWPLSSKVCPVLGCPLPSQVDPDKILSTNLVIRSHPYTEGALLVDAIIINTAEFSQPFPPLTLAFENLQGDVVARRTFNPSEYLMGEAAGMAEIPSKRPIKLELEILDPGKDAVSFHFFIAKKTLH